SVLVEDLCNLARGSGAGAAQALRDVFLVLPEVPDNVPQWIDAFERLQVTPRARDIAVLLKAVEARSPFP
ncbi:MAG: hypothetical protein OXR73_20060, partial [Myxococcales bacterium]|nr:hypothetical protein [Myxococcales bacterium]